MNQETAAKIYALGRALRDAPEDQSLEKTLIDIGYPHDTASLIDTDEYAILNEANQAYGADNGEVFHCLRNAPRNFALRVVTYAWYLASFDEPNVFLANGKVTEEQVNRLFSSPFDFGGTTLKYIAFDELANYSYPAPVVTGAWKFRTSALDLPRVYREACEVKPHPVVEVCDRTSGQRYQIFSEYVKKVLDSDNNPIIWTGFVKKFYTDDGEPVYAFKFDPRGDISTEQLAAVFRDLETKQRRYSVRVF